MMIKKTAGILGVLLLVVSCRTSQNLSIEEIPQIITETQLREYNYALTEATKQKLFGNFREAASLYQKCIEVNPQSDAAHFQLAGILLIAGDLEGAKSLNKKAIEIDPENYWYRIQLGQNYLMSEEPDSAIMVYEEIIEKWPEKVEIQYEMARLYSETGSNNKALRILNEIERKNGLSEPVSMLKEQIYMLEKKPSMAEKELLALIELYPDEIRYMGILAELYTTIGEKEKAVKVYQRIFEIEPESGIAQLSMAEFYRLNEDPVNQFVYLEKAFENSSLEIEAKIAVMIELLTQEVLYQKHKDEILLLIKVLGKKYPDDYRVKAVNADYLNRTEKYEEALDLYNQVLKEYKSNYYIWEQSIFIGNMLGRTKEVYEKCTEALSFFSDQPLLYLFKGNAATQLGYGGEAIQTLEKGIEYAGSNVPLMIQFYSFLAEAYRNEKNYVKSDGYFEQAIEMDPMNLMILNNYSYYLSLRGAKLNEAEEMSKKTIIAEPENHTYLDTYAWVLDKSGKYEKAKEYLERAMEHGGDSDPDIVEHYGDVLNDLGMKDDALNYWKKAKELGSESETLEKKLKD